MEAQTVLESLTIYRLLSAVVAQKSVNALYFRARSGYGVGATIWIKIYHERRKQTPRQPVCDEGSIHSVDMDSLNQRSKLQRKSESARIRRSHKFAGLQQTKDCQRWANCQASAGGAINRDKRTNHTKKRIGEFRQSIEELSSAQVLTRPLNWTGNEKRNELAKLILDCLEQSKSYKIRLEEENVGKISKSKQETAPVPTRVHHIKHIISYACFFLTRKSEFIRNTFCAGFAKIQSISYNFVKS